MDEPNEMPAEIDAIAEIDWHALAEEAGVRIWRPGSEVKCLCLHRCRDCDCRAVREHGVLQLCCSNFECHYKLSQKNARLEELSREAIRAVYRAAELREERRLLDCGQEGGTQ